VFHEQAQQPKAGPGSPISHLILDILGGVRASLSKFRLSCLLFSVMTGCSKINPPPSDAGAEARQAAHAAQQAEDSARQEIEQIPPPAKSRYLAVHTQDRWANPFLTVGRETIHMRVILPDVMPKAYGTGTMLRPADARKQELDVRLADLPAALAAVPQGAWPYGRVIGVEETPIETKADRPAVRRNVEATIQLLNELGIVVDEWTGPNGSLLR
jgi:hypothetical protein